MRLPKFYFKVCSIDENGDVEESRNFRDYGKAIQFKNDLTRKEVAAVNEMLISQNEWGEYIEEIKENLEDFEKITCRAYPLIVIEEDDDKEINYIPFYSEDNIELRQIVIELIEE